MWFPFSRTSGRWHPRPTRPARRASTRLILERLEDRTVPSFLAPVSYPVDPSGNLAVAVADFDGDGTPDLVTLAPTYGGVAVALGNRDGTFKPARIFGVAGGNPTSVAVGDFNGDGKPDIVTTDNYSNDVNVLLGNGDGTFQVLPSFQLPLFDVPLAVAVGDLNGDGKPDLVILSATSTYNVHVLLGHGDGTFSDSFTAQLPALVSDQPPLALGDFNGDGKLDVVTADSAGVLVMLGNGDGTLGAPSTYATNGSPAALAVGDFNGDGRLDLATAGGGTSSTPGAVSILLGNGDGTFQSARSFADGLDPQSLAVADFNGDGKADLAEADFGFNGANAGVSVLLGNGDGTFQNALKYPAGPNPVAVVAADFNADGFPDLAVANNADSANVSVLLNAADWSAPQASSIVVNGFPSPTTAGAAGALTVTVKYADGATDTSYKGTVLFTSSDPHAVLPAAYTFTAADAGVHTFSAALNTAGTQSITATDYTTGTVSSTDAGITVNPAAASTLSVTGFPSPTTAGVAGGFTVTARDPYGNAATGYTGTVHFTSSDGKASLPANYTFTAADAGVHAFSATLRTAGVESISATDTTTAGVAGTEGGITVNPSAASQFILSGPTSVTAGATFSLTLTVEDAYGNVVTGYTGTVRFTSTDPKAKLPMDYTFTASDQGVHTFTSTVLRTTGYQTITVTDTLDAALDASLIVDVLAPKKK
jgi:hypothetical protein